MKVLHVITGLNSGGAERMMVNVIGALPQHEHHVLCLTESKFYLKELQMMDCSVTFLGSRNPIKIIHAIRSQFSRGNFEVLQSWMFHADFFSSLALASRSRHTVVWGVQAGELPSAQFGIVIRTLRRILAFSSAFMCHRVIVCSNNASQVLTRVGYSQKKIVVIPNSIDTELFAPKALLTQDSEHLKCIVPARWHPMKDHASLLTAFRFALEDGLRARIWLVGKDMDEGNLELKDLVDNCGVSEYVDLLGERSDMVDLYQEADFICMSSCSGEGLPLALCEAMASGLPAVVTDVGDMALVVGTTGFIVPAQDPKSLSKALFDLGQLDATTFINLKNSARDRIVSEFSILNASSKYYDVWQSASLREVN
jgi:glycosyltransferase involved in cell wall biosynthesis